MKKIITCLIIVLSIFLFTGCTIKVNIPKSNNKKTNTTTKEEQKKENNDNKGNVVDEDKKEQVSSEDLTKNIIETEEICANGKLILFVENKNDI